MNDHFFSGIRKKSTSGKPETGMTNQQNSDLTPDSAFFDLLLEQFRGVEGELPMATAYFAQAVDETDATYKTTLTRIAKEKISNARVLASILLELAKGQQAGQQDLEVEPDYDQLRTLLIDKGIENDVLRDTQDAAERTAGAASRAEQAEAGMSREHYLRQYIATEDKQIAIYERLITMTSNSYFLAALNQATQRQIKHRNEFAQLLEATVR
ncbi:manganese catalase family protein [Pseudomonas sp. CDFA 602]|uniref:manganese catalase family protein n=1 Tax=Pseudomonas californiensis TaxID=2829823 RepID=UPI001E379785|nr:manganese catalase family protein [Pseudomonas californiensis]MCD5995694.1 manganese catalase family protein [Pseudomonas californiensis]MCD6001288.1 manganese catalase family protein [Pseudomonas californiensis]